MSFAHFLAAAIDGDVRADSLIFTRDGDVVRVVDCRPTGKVFLNTEDGRYQLGSMADSVEHLASMYYAATAEVCS